MQHDTRAYVFNVYESMFFLRRKPFNEPDPCLTFLNFSYNVVRFFAFECRLQTVVGSSLGKLTYIKYLISLRPNIKGTTFSRPLNAKSEFIRFQEIK